MNEGVYGVFGTGIACKRMFRGTSNFVIMAHIHSLLSLFFIIYIIVYTLVCGSCLVSDVAKSGLYSSRMQGQVQTIKSSKILYQHRAGHLTISCSTFDGDLVDMCKFIHYRILQTLVRFIEITYCAMCCRRLLVLKVCSTPGYSRMYTNLHIKWSLDDEAYSNTLITS